MCRIAAWIGAPRPLEDILVQPAHSLLQQSKHATEAKLAVNGDGFGMAWYHPNDPAPGIYKDVLPAWADDNLVHLARMIRSGLFLAHVRASTMGETARMNCHPFSHGRWSFCHNGQIPHIQTRRRAIEAKLPDALYLARRGNTDSELLFLTLLAQGFEKDPAGAFRRSLDIIGPAGPLGPVRASCVLSDGQQIVALRYASDGRCPTLYTAQTKDGVCVASEPLGLDADWTALPDNSIAHISANKVEARALSSVAQVA